jgi:hypothetical protein
MTETLQLADAARAGRRHGFVQRRHVARKAGVQLAAGELQRMAIVELGQGRLVDVDDAHVVEQQDDAVVELVERGGQPVADGRRGAVVGDVGVANGTGRRHLRQRRDGAESGALDKGGVEHGGPFSRTSRSSRSREVRKARISCEVKMAWRRCGIFTAPHPQSRDARAGCHSRRPR